MAITVNEHWSRRRANADRHGEYVLQNCWRAITDGGEAQRDVLLDPAIPDIGDEHPDFEGAYCTAIECDQDQDQPFAWMVVATYETRYALPTDRPKEVEWDSVEYQVAVTKDVDDHAVVNSAGEPFDPPLEEQEFDLVLRVTQNLSTFDPATILTYQNKINSSTLDFTAKSGETYHFSTGTALCTKVRAVLSEEQGVQFYRRTVEILIRTPDWSRKLVDMGFREKDSGTGKLTNIVDSGGQPITRPALLDGSGAKIENPTPADAVILTFHIKGEADLNALGL